MKVRISYTVDVPDEHRRAIRNYYSDDPGLATRQEIKDWYKVHGEAMDDELQITYSDKWEDEDA